MPAQITFGQLRKSLTEAHANWNIGAHIKDTDVIPEHKLGGHPGNIPLAAHIGKIDLHSILNTVPSNPLLVERRIAHGFLAPTAQEVLHSTKLAGSAHVAMTAAATGAHAATAAAAAGVHATAAHLAPPVAAHLAPPVAAVPPPTGGGGRPAVVDWRNRWGWPWECTVQDQIGENCWAMASTALVESMVRINHAVWSKRSEGDPHDGMGSPCGNGGSASACLDWIKNNGITDEQSYPNQCNLPYHQGADRPGRICKIGDHTFIGDIEQQKVWIDSVGPLVTWFDVWHDFDGYYGIADNVVYRWSATVGGQPNYERGGHFMLVVGYDDNLGAWICRNSWGTSFGHGGYIHVAYGDAKSGIDSYSKMGLKDPNPDPWTKHRLHNGNIIESGDGALHRNFEMVATANGNQIRHWWRDGSDFSWHQAETFGNDAAVCPTLIQTTYNRNFELVYMTGAGRLHHWFYDQAGGHWADGGIFGPHDAFGVAGFIQGNYGSPGNFEVVVHTKDGKLNHWWRMNGPPWTWTDGGRFGDGIMLSGATLVQSRYGHNGNLELVAVCHTGELWHFWRDDDHGFVWHPGVCFGTGYSSPPVMIEGQFGATDENTVGNFELCVAKGGKVDHWWRDNHGNTGWHMSATFGHDVAAVAGLVEGSFGFNLEVIVLRTDHMLQHYWRDGAGWHEGPVIGPA